MSDKHWQEVMKLAEKYGFIVQSYGGAAILATHANQREHYGEEEYLRIQRMNGREIPNEIIDDDGQEGR